MSSPSNQWKEEVEATKIASDLRDMLFGLYHQGKTLSYFDPEELVLVNDRYTIREDHPFADQYYDTDSAYLLSELLPQSAIDYSGRKFYYSEKNISFVEDSQVHCYNTLRMFRPKVKKTSIDDSWLNLEIVWQQILAYLKIKYWVVPDHDDSIFTPDWILEQTRIRNDYSRSIPKGSYYLINFLRSRYYQHSDLDYLLDSDLEVQVKSVKRLVKFLNWDLKIRKHQPILEQLEHFDCREVIITKGSDRFVASRIKFPFENFNDLTFYGHLYLSDGRHFPARAKIDRSQAYLKPPYYFDTEFQYKDQKFSVIEDYQELDPDNFDVSEVKKLAINLISQLQQIHSQEMVLPQFDLTDLGKFSSGHYGFTIYSQASPLFENFYSSTSISEEPALGWYHHYMPAHNFTDLCLLLNQLTESDYHVAKLTEYFSKFPPNQKFSAQDYLEAINCF